MCITEFCDGKSEFLKKRSVTLTVVMSVTAYDVVHKKTTFLFMSMNKAIANFKVAIKQKFDEKCINIVPIDKRYRLLLS